VHLSDSAETRENLAATIQRSPGAIAVIRSQGGAFLDLAFTADGSTLLTSGNQDNSKLTKYDAVTRTLVGSVPGTTGELSMGISADGRYTVVSGSTFQPEGTYLQILDTNTFQPVGGPLSAPRPDSLTHLSFSPDGRYVAAVTDTDQSGAGVSAGTGLVWDVARGGEAIVQYSFSAPNFRRDIAFSADSTRVFVPSPEGTAVIDIASNAQVGMIEGAHAPIAISPDGTTLAAATDVDRGDIIGLFDPTTGVRRELLAGHRGRNVRLAFSRDSTMLASGADDHLVIVWNLATGDRAQLEGHSAGINAVTFSPDGRTLWSGGDDRTVIEWDLKRAYTFVHVPAAMDSNAPQAPLDTQGMVIDPSGRYVVLPSTDITPFEIRDAQTGALVSKSLPTDGDFISFSPDDSRYLTVDGSGVMRVWELQTGRLMTSSSSTGQFFSGFHEGVAAFTPDGRHIVAIRLDPAYLENLVVLDADTLTPVAEPVSVGHTVRMLGVAPDGRTAIVVVSQGFDPDVPGTRVRVVDLETGQIVRTTAILYGAAQLFTGARNDTVAADGRTVGLGSSSGDVAIVDAITGEYTVLPRAHDDYVESVTFAPDYSTFLTTARNGQVKVWDMTTHQVLASLLPFGEHRVRGAYLAADRVLLVDDRGKFLEWDPRPDAWVDYACNVAGRNLTQAEWAEFFADQPYHATCPQFPEGT
jgi:WD40 repeat protein